jgi:hypothetical protein
MSGKGSGKIRPRDDAPEQIKLWSENNTRLTNTEKKQIEDLAEERRAKGEDFCPYKRVDENKKPFCSITTRVCHREESYIECTWFQEFYTEEIACRFEDLLPVGAPL